MLSKYGVWMVEHEETLQAIIDKGEHGRSDWNEPEDLVPDLLGIGLDHLTEEFPEAFIIERTPQDEEEDGEEIKEEVEEVEEDEYYGNDIE